MTNAALVDALHRAIRELERVGEHSSIVKEVMTNLQKVIDRTLEDELDADARFRRALKRMRGTDE